MKRTTKRLIGAGALLVGLLASALPAGPVSASATPDAPSTSDVVPLVVGGRNASEPYPGMASIQWTRNGDPYWNSCGATLIHPRFLLTNAHCGWDLTGAAPVPLDPANLRVRIGSHDRTSGGFVSPVAEFLIHSEWDWGAGDDRVADIALVRLPNPVPVQPYRLATSETGTATNIGRILGWGSITPDRNNPVYPEILQELDVRVLPNQDCEMGGLPISEGEICFDSPGGAGVCYGDSGGPGLRRAHGEWRVLGGASRETSAACGVSPTIYTSAVYYRDWIDEVIRTGVVPPRANSATAGTPSSADLHRWLAGV
ncbi:S1 family peptidase [Plantactinospora sp. WMMB782]|uniref:S1 family peptidase n=1 Tax=Plantactinospora sp. WMMB782 TaxID=3404121 RepID=UPI003B93ABC8